MLELDLSVRRGDFTLRAALTVPDGATGICGPSGSGKSTLLALVAGLLRPDSGTLHFRGELLAEAGTRHYVPAWQRHFALVFQDGQLFPHLTVAENLVYGYRRRAPQDRRLQPAAVLELLEIGPLQERRPAQLSGGERQRVALGRALLCSPRLLLLDEPLASLDERLRQQILPFLVRVRDESGIPMLYVSHSAAEVGYVAERLLRIEDGQVLAAAGGHSDRATS